jgi:hypothetical protein
MNDGDSQYAFPHGAADERRRLELLQERLDPITIGRIERLGLAPGARCLEVGGGRGSITRWLSKRVGPSGRITATDLDVGFLSELSLPNVEVRRHDVRKLDIVQAGTPLAEFYRLSTAATATARIRAGVITPEEAAALAERIAEPDFLACGFVHMAAWGRRPAPGGEVTRP